MTENALVTLTPEEQAYLESLQTKGGGTPQFNQLVINTASTDADGNKQTPGSWHIKNTDKYFDGPITFRPVRYMDQLVKYESTDGGKTWEFAGNSVYFNDYRDEILDSLGGVAFGRKFGRELRALSEAEQEANRKLAGTYKDIWGFVTFGDSEPMPVVFRVRGGKFNAMLEAFNSVPKDKRYSQYNYTIKTLQKIDPKTKKVDTYWSIDVTPDMSKVLPIAPILGFDREVCEYIDYVNEQVNESHFRNRKVAQKTPGDDAKVINAKPTTKPSSIILDDELPF